MLNGWRGRNMGDVLVLILLAVLVTVGMVMFVGGIVGLAINVYRSMRRRARLSAEEPTSAGAEAAW